MVRGSLQQNAWAGLANGLIDAHTGARHARKQVSAIGELPGAALRNVDRPARSGRNDRSPLYGLAAGGLHVPAR